MPLFACERGASPNRPYPPPGDVHVGYVSEYERCRVTIGLVRPYLGAKSAPPAGAVLHFFASDTIRMRKALRRTARARPRTSTLWPTFDDCAPDRAHIDTTAADRNGCARAWFRKASKHWLMLRRSDRRCLSCWPPIESSVLHAAVRAARGIVAIVQSRLLLASTEGRSGTTCCSSLFIVRADAR